MKTDYCAYPPELAADAEITEQRDAERTVYIVGSAAVGRYLLLRDAEHRVMSLIDGARAAGDVCGEFERATGAALRPATLVKFLSKLDDYGILAGERSQGAAAPETLISQLHYVRFKLFNPDPLFARLAPRLRWIWTTRFFALTMALMVLAALLALMNSAEVASYGSYTLGEHWVAVFVAAWLVGVTHEFAHGMRCKAFGGRATEVGALLVYYFLPALYCNVSAIHLIPQRNRRLWVIAAGVYWQLMVGSAALLAWFCLAPYTLLADVAFVFLLGSVLDVFFNANPLIKLDGYYFFSQWLRLPNLMDRSRGYWRGVLKRIMFGERNTEAARYDRRERRIYLVFGLLSFVYNMVFASLIVILVGGWLIDRFYLPGLTLAIGVALIFMRRPVTQVIQAIREFWGNAALSARECGRRRRAWGGARSAEPQAEGHSKSIEPAERAAAVDGKTLSPAGAGLDDSLRGAPRVPRCALHPGLYAFARIRGLVRSCLMAVRQTKEGEMSDKNQTTTHTENMNARPPFWRRRLVPILLVLLVVAVLMAPWSASVGNYGPLVAIPGQEAIIRAPENATLIAVDAQPGTQLAAGASVGRMGNFDLEEQIAGAQSELARANADYDRLLGELRARSETAARAELLLRQRQTDFDEINDERQQIERRRIAEAGSRPPQVMRISAASSFIAGSAGDAITVPERLVPSYPAALAALQAEVDSFRAQLSEAGAQRDRARQLYAQGIMPRSEMDAAETRAAMLTSALAAARERLEAALIEHHRRHMSTTTELNVARSDRIVSKIRGEE